MTPELPAYQNDTTSDAVTSPHSLAEALALSAKVIGRVLQGASLNAALQSLKELRPSLRAAAQDLSYNTLRAWGRVDVMADRLLDKPLQDAVLRGLILSALQELHTRPETAHTVVFQAVEAATLLGQARARGLVNAVLRSYQRSAGDLQKMISGSETGQFAHPQWWIDAVKSAHPGHWRQILEAANSHPPMSLRINLRRTTSENYLERLRAAGLSAHPLGETAVMLARPQRVENLPGFLEGDVSVQDVGAQWAAPLLDVHPGMRVLDACAAPGGKTGHILELADCDLLAVDISPERTRRITENLQRLSLPAKVKVGDSLHPAGFAEKGVLFERILLDVLCSASGVVRRHPDIRWLRRESDLAGFAKTQKRMLDALWPLLERDGKLLYTTCSVFPVENELQIQAFLDRHDDARQLPLPGLASGQLLPCAEHDGFYYALLHKQG